MFTQLTEKCLTTVKKSIACRFFFRGIMSAENLKHNCGVFAIYDHRKAAELTYFGLYSLQHRGQESAGIATSDNGEIHVYKNMGLINEVFSRKEVFHNLKGKIAIGHNRYSTTGSSHLRNAQPLFSRFKGYQLAVGHNGNITNSYELRHKLEAAGAIFQTSSDSELFLHLIARSRKEKMADKIKNALKQIQGAYCVVILCDDKIYAARDPRGFRPLALGKMRNTYVVASETCAFDLIGAKYIRDISPGEIIRLDQDGLKSFHPFPQIKKAFCIFEFIYFSRPDSKIFGENVDKVRRRLGRQLAREHPVEADIVISVPDSSNTAALGYSEASGLRMEIGFIRNHYVGRTFIDPEQKIRDLDVKIKFNTVRGVIEGRRIVVVDDSIVRGTTSRKLIKMLKQAGAKEVHIRISSPPIIAPCFYGIDMPTKKELIASSTTVEQIRKYLGATTLGYLSIPGMLSMNSLPDEDFCVGCFSGKYPIKLGKTNGKFRLE
jgi:amidophosphoribosyltransferase